MKKLLKNNKGFTLVELIVVIVILGILAAILVPSLLKWIDKARQTKLQSDAYNVYTVIQQLISNEYANADPQFGNVLNAQTLTTETGVDFTSTGRARVECNVIRKASSSGSSIFINKYKFFDVKTGTTLYFDAGNGSWTAATADSIASTKVTDYTSSGKLQSAATGVSAVSNTTNPGIQITLYGFSGTATASEVYTGAEPATNAS
jgi:type IV pilus assembly protein PilA